MLKAKDVFLEDLKVFFDIDEFGEIHNIDGRNLNVIIDNDSLEERSRREYDGVYVGDLLYFVKEKDYGEIPKPDSLQRFDGKIYTVFNVRKDTGIYEIILSSNES